jgi:hypothetical protein
LPGAGFSPRPAARKIERWGYLTEVGPGPVFVGVEKPMKVYTIDNILFTHAKVPDDVVYNVIETMEANEDDMIAVQAAAQTMGLQLKMFNASTLNELNTAFAAIAEQRPDALLVGTDPFFLLRREELTVLAARIGAPAIYPFREFAPSGGLISYGTNIASSYRQAGIYTGRILKGAKPAELPIMLPTQFQMGKFTNGGLIVTRTSETIEHRNVIVRQAARHRLPAVYPLRFPT